MTTTLIKKLQLKCANKVTLEKTSLVLSDKCPNCDGYDTECEGYISIKRSQIPTRNGYFAQKEYFEKWCGDL